MHPDTLHVPNGTVHDSTFCYQMCLVPKKVRDAIWPLSVVIMNLMGWMNWKKRWNDDEFGFWILQETRKGRKEQSYSLKFTIWKKVGIFSFSATFFISCQRKQILHVVDRLLLHHIVVDWFSIRLCTIAVTQV